MDNQIPIKSVAVFGLGYVGITTAACLAKLGFSIVGVDVDERKVSDVAGGRSPISEAEVEELLTEAVARGTLTATSDVQDAIRETDAALICVGTPSRPGGQPDLVALVHVAQQIGKALRKLSRPYSVIVRSTVPPGTMSNVFIPSLEAALGNPIGGELHVLYHPEFLREGVSVADFMAPPKIVFGTDDSSWADRAIQLYDSIDAPRFVVGLHDAEFVKYMDNPWHALKIAFANEMGSLAHACGASIDTVFNIFLSDHKLNISERYLRPGFTFGGSCLPKDLRAVTAMAREKFVDVPLLESVLLSNTSHLRRVADAIASTDAERIGIWGLAFKHGTDDLRESGSVELACYLLGRGYDVRIWDEFVDYKHLVGKNKAFIDRRIGHLADHMVDQASMLSEWAELVVVTTNDPKAKSLSASGVKVLDVSGSGIGLEIK
jgi:GDP-mannose 6-dehydrogenase